MNLRDGIRRLLRRPRALLVLFVIIGATGAVAQLAKPWLDWLPLTVGVAGATYLLRESEVGEPDDRSDDR